MSEYEYDVCLSFAGEQRPYVEGVAAGLKTAGLTVFYDDYETADLLGKNLTVHLDEVYRHRSAYCAVFVSADYVRKKWTTHELQSALARSLMSVREYIIPVRFDDTDVPGLLPTVAYVDARRMPPAELVQVIVGKVRSTPLPPPERRPHALLTAADIPIMQPEQVAHELVSYDVDASARLLASTDAVAAADVLVSMDEALAVRIVSAMNPRRAELVLTQLPSETRDPFDAVVAAAVEVTKCWRQYRHLLGDPVGPLSQERSNRRSGFRRTYVGGEIYWAEDLGAYPVRGGIAAYRDARQGSARALGFPHGPEKVIRSPLFGTTGSVQEFEEVKYRAGTATDDTVLRFRSAVYWSDRHGAHAVRGWVGRHYHDSGAVDGELGFPVGEERPLRHRGLVQRFEGGAIFWSRSRGPVTVPAAIAAVLDDLESSVDLYPVDVPVVSRSDYGTNGVSQHFTVTTKSTISRQPARSWHQTVHSSPYGRFITPEIVDLVHRDLGGVTGVLGYPTSGLRGSDTSQDFEGGRITVRYVDLAEVAVAVLGDVFELVKDQEVAEHLGSPVAEADVLGGTTVQFFENGVVTVRDGVAEWWVRP